MRIGFDFDGVLSKGSYFAPIAQLIVYGQTSIEPFVLTTRDEIDNDMDERLKALFGRYVYCLAIGKSINSNLPYKADILVTPGIKEDVDLFFDDDFYEVKRFHELNIPCVHVVPLRGDDTPMAYVQNMVYQQLNGVL